MNNIYTISRSALLEVFDPEVKESYKSSINETTDSFTVNLLHDINTQFSIACNDLNPTNEQFICLENLRKGFANVQNMMNPDRLNFTFSKAIDDEICLNRFSQNGLSKLIINDDGTLAYSFIAFKGIDKNDRLDFYLPEIAFDVEKVVFNFLSF